MCGRLLLFLCLALLLPLSSWAADTVDYLKEIKPVLAAKCYACHGALQQKNGLRVDTVQFMLEGGNKGPVVVPGQSQMSSILDHVTGANKARRMPPPMEGEPLAPGQVARLREWIDQGARGPADEKPEADPRDHWAFRAPVRPPLPPGAKQANPIDAFIAAQLEAKGLAPQRPADKRVLLRRAYIDLIGLPPTLEEQEAFLKDTAVDAYEKVVDRLLASPQYGERWGRHWMDIWRYSDWWGLGLEVRNSQKHIWHWRDWIIESLNADKGYDEMVREMLAADELYPKDLERLRATGYLVRPYFIFNRSTWLDETIEHTSKAFLGLTLNCVKCHDHKYDPFAHADYYRFRAFFEPYQVRTDQAPGETDFEKDGIPRVFDANLDAPTYLHIRGDDRNPDKDKIITPGLPRVLTWAKLDIESIKLPSEAYMPGTRSFVADNYLVMARKQIESARAGVDVARKAVAAAEQKSLDVATIKEATATVLLKDDFAKADPEKWELIGDKWRIENGKLLQTFDGPMRAALRVRVPTPQDFQAGVQFAITGGTPYRSLGIAFDAAGDNEALVYVSAQEGKPRLQVTYKLNGKSVYPTEASVPYPIKLNQLVDMQVRIRGDLINVALDGKHILAYRLPIPRQKGSIAIITYTATARFDSFELADLPTDVLLAKPGPAAKPSTPAKTLSSLEAKAALVFAEKSLLAAEAELASVNARLAADRAPKAGNALELAREAAKAEKQAAVAKADAVVAQAELALSQGPPDKKGDADKNLAVAQSAFAAARKSLEAPGDKYTPFRGSRKAPESSLIKTDPLTFPDTSSGRRSALAKWITDRRNPLAARVAVNHLWGRHFGQPLVANVFDFGRKGTPPSHPELLDWLAVELMDNGWRMKPIHRLMVTSSVYRASSSNADRETNLAKDPENRSFWRMNPLRMEAQIVRDSLLHLAGELDLRLGGPSIPIAQESKRRSLYFVHSNNDQQKFLSLFDDANVRECYRRSESIVPQQALALSNSQFALSSALKIHERLQRQFGKASDTDYVRAAFELVLGSAPTPEEHSECEAALREFGRLAPNQADAQSRARANLLHALLNHNDFITVR